MRSATFNNTLVNHQKLRKTESKDWTVYAASIDLAVGGGLFFILLGFFLLAIFTVFDRNNAALNYAGAGSLVIAFIFFGFSAHFMDKSEENNHWRKRCGIENYNRE